MIKHFDTIDAAIADLKAHGCLIVMNGNWANQVCAAQIVAHPQAPVVVVHYWKI